MSETQSYKILTLSRSQVIELQLAIAAQVAFVRRVQEEAVTVDIADEYRQRELTLRNIHAVLVLP